MNASAEGRLHSVTLEKLNLITNRNGRENDEFTRSNCWECLRLFESSKRFKPELSEEGRRSRIYVFRFNQLIHSFIH
jgi:hypothetical protein